MNAQPPRRRPYWLVIALAAVLASPLATSLPALAVFFIAAMAFRFGRAIVGARVPRRSAAALVVGRDRRGRQVTLSARQLAAHGLILGATGSGKSTTMLRILTEQVRRGEPVVAVDLKGSPEFTRALAEAAAAAGRPFRMWSPDGPTHWNPLQYGNATELKDKLIATERFTEPHYQRAAERYAQGVLQVLEHARPGSSATLEEVVRLMEPRRLSAMLRAVPRPLAVRVQDYLAGLTPDQLSAIRGLETRLAVVTESHVGRYLAPGAPAQTLDLHAALSGREVLVFSLNSSSYGALAAQLGTLVIQDLVSAAGARLGERAARQASVAVDEFSVLGSDQISALFARARGAGMSVLLATQELVDLERAARGLRDQVIGNTAIKLVHRQEVHDSALTVAQMAGTELVWEETRQIGSPFGQDTGRGTRRQVERFVVHPNTIKTLAPGEAVLIVKDPSASVRIVQVSPPARHPQLPLARSAEPQPARTEPKTASSSLARTADVPVPAPSPRPDGTRAPEPRRVTNDGRRPSNRGPELV
jgi:type IV secretory pathway TraG/TraD family ATPase VirD4